MWDGGFVNASMPQTHQSCGYLKCYCSETDMRVIHGPRLSETLHKYTNLNVQVDSWGRYSIHNLQADCSNNGWLDPQGSWPNFVSSATLIHLHTQAESVRICQSDDHSRVLLMNLLTVDIRRMGSARDGGREAWRHVEGWISVPPALIDIHARYIKILIVLIILLEDHNWILIYYVWHVKLCKLGMHPA